MTPASCRRRKPKSQKIPPGDIRGRFPVAATIRHDFPCTFGPVLIVALGLPTLLSGNNCLTYTRASDGFALVPEKSGVWTYTPLNIWRADISPLIWPIITTHLGSSSDQAVSLNRQGGR